MLRMMEFQLLIVLLIVRQVITLFKAMFKEL